MARDYKQDWQREKERQDKNPRVLKAKLARQKLRREYDAEGISRDGKDIAHRKALSLGGTNKDGAFLDTPSNNRSYARRSDHKPKSKTDRPGPK